jgi:hypothetical protein
VEDSEGYPPPPLSGLTPSARRARAGDVWGCAVSGGRDVCGGGAPPRGEASAPPWGGGGFALTRAEVYGASSY